MIRVVSFALLVLVMIHTWWWVSALAVLLYMYIYGGYETLIIAALVDGFYGGGQIIPYYTLGVACLFVIMEMSRPYVKAPEELW